MPDRPQGIIREWSENGAIVEPGSTKQQNGFLRGEQPAAGHFNWLFNRMTKNINYARTLDLLEVNMSPRIQGYYNFADNDLATSLIVGIDGSANPITGAVIYIAATDYAVVTYNPIRHLFRTGGDINGWRAVPISAPGINAFADCAIKKTGTPYTDIAIFITNGNISMPNYGADYFDPLIYAGTNYWDDPDNIAHSWINTIYRDGEDDVWLLMPGIWATGATRPRRMTKANFTGDQVGTYIATLPIRGDAGEWFKPNMLPTTQRVVVATKRGAPFNNSTVYYSDDQALTFSAGYAHDSYIRRCVEVPGTDGQELVGIGYYSDGATNAISRSMDAGETWSTYLFDPTDSSKEHPHVDLSDAANPQLTVCNGVIVLTGGGITEYSFDGYIWEGGIVWNVLGGVFGSAYGEQGKLLLGCPYLQIMEGLATQSTFIPPE